LCKFTHLQNLFNHIKTYSNKSWIQFLLFSGVIWLIFVHLHINRHLEDIIIGPHYWRKSDTFAQIMNYYYNGLNFFDHGIYFNQMDSNGKAVAEFPLIYWLIALQLKIFGKHLLIIKINYIVILFAGLFSVFKISNYFLKNMVLSLCVATLLFLSPIFTFYATAYLPDPLALNIICIGMWLLMIAIRKKTTKSLVLAMLIIGVAGMIKPFFLIPYIAFLVTVLVNLIVRKKDTITFNWLYIVPFVLVGTWFFYTNWYNASVGSDYFLSEARPIWNYSSQSIDKTWTRIIERWLPEYIHPNLLWPFIGLIAINLVWWKKGLTSHNIYYLFSVLGCFSFIILFFNMFEHHDYYIFPLFFILPLTIGLFVLKIVDTINSKWFGYIFGIALLVPLFLGLNNTWDITEARRKTPWINSKHMFENYQGLDYFLLKNGVQESDLIFAFSDKSPSFALSLMDRKGWSGFQTKPNKFELPELIDQGAAYLIMNKNAPLLQNDSIISNQYLDYPIDDTNNIYLYDLKPYKN